MSSLSHNSFLHHRLLHNLHDPKQDQLSALLDGHFTPKKKKEY